MIVVAGSYKLGGETEKSERRTTEGERSSCSDEEKVSCDKEGVS